MELAGADREVYNGGNCRNNDWRTLFKEPSWDSARVALVIGRVEKNWKFQIQMLVEKSGRLTVGEGL